MEYRKLKGTNLKVSRLTLGCEQFGGMDWGDYDENSLKETIDKGLESGINTFDTADVYGLGKSEEFLGNALHAVKSDVIIMSKFGVNWKKNTADKRRAKTYIDCSPERVREALEASLKRLKIDSIPIYFIHKPDPVISIFDTLKALQKFKEQGKIQHIGVSNFPLELVKKAYSTGLISCVQIQYNLLMNKEANKILDFCYRNELNVFTYGALAQGLLAGKYNTASIFTDTDRRHRLSHFQGRALEENVRKIEKLKGIAGKNGISLAQLAIKYVLNRPEIISVIVGAKTPEQISENTRIVDLKLNGSKSLEINID